MVVIGTNAAGLLNKKESLHRTIELLSPSVIMVQETKARRKNKIKLKDYVIFEHIRPEKGGGGLLSAVHRNLEPVSIATNSETEIMVVEAKTGNTKTRFINAYGPQENSEEEIKEEFYNQLDVEIKKAKVAGSLICIEMDANAKLGSKFIKNDPHLQSKNGELLETIVEENDLIVVNGTEVCDGLITRKRVTVTKTEESILDYFIVCKDMFKRVQSMKIDEERKHAFTKYSTTRGRKSVKISDHNLLTLEFKAPWNTKSENKNPRIEIFNYSDQESFTNYCEVTEKNEALIECFNDESEDLQTMTTRWMKVFNNILRRSFKKIRIRKFKADPNLNALFTTKETLTAKLAQARNDDKIDTVNIIEEEIENTNEKISQICAENNKKIVEDYLEHASDGVDGFGHQKVWKMKKLLAPKNTFEPPTAKKDAQGNLITDLKNLENLYLHTYLNRLQPNQVEPHLQHLQQLKEYLFQLRLQLARGKKTPEWTLKDLEKVLKSLKNNKARDAHGHVYELFKYGGKDLKLSILKMFNLVKERQEYPEILKASNISSFWKQKGAKDDINNERGVFLVVKLRTILDKLIYNDKYDIIDKNMGNSNIGGRKGRNIRDHLFVVNAVLNDVNKTKKEDIDIQIYDVKKCFDKLWFSETANDIFDVGVDDDQFVTIANSNKECKVAVKTPWGSTTERKVLKDIEMQGTVITSLKCSVQIDTLGKETLNRGGNAYKYKECLPIPSLSFVDDVLGIAHCGSDSLKLNSIIQSKMSTKKLELGQDKCFQMHIGTKSPHLCPKLNIQKEQMKTTSSEKYLGDIINNTGRLNENIQARVSKATGTVNTIMSLIDEISFGHYTIQTALLFRNSMLVNSILSSSEVLYGLKNDHIKKLEGCDKTLFRKLFNVPITCSYEAFYLETGCLSINYTLKGRRLMYYWTLLNKSDAELAKQVFQIQNKFSVKDDWVKQVKEDLDELEIQLSEGEISKMKYEAFKKVVKTKLNVKFFDYLLSLKSSHTKTQNLSSYKLQEYLESENLTYKQKQLLFSLRTRSINVKTNYKSKYKHSNLFCTLCDDRLVESESHLLECKSTLEQLGNIGDARYEDIFSPEISRQEKITKIYEKVLKLRQNFIL